ncbi:MAG: glucokinase [Burkholderiaceae bacterium]|nr:glucokinase [Burkholderiaceae bacterium]
MRGYPRLLGDIGGTNARWAWRAAPEAPLQHISARPCAEHATLADSALDYLSRHGLGTPAWMAFGVATAVTGDRVHLTNRSWAFSIHELQRLIGAERCLVLNDFTALAMSLPLLEPGDLRLIGGAGAAVPGAPAALLGPGTGFGVSGLINGPGGPCAISGEGGHATLAASDDEEAALIHWMRGRHSHVSAERVLSGPGLLLLYEAVCAREGRAPLALEPPDVTRRAIEGSDAACVGALRLFTGWLGGVAGDLALTLGARGGVYIGGGVVPRLGTGLDEALFRRRFEGKGRFAHYLQAIPAWVIVASTPALLGADRALTSWPA